MSVHALLLSLALLGQPNPRCERATIVSVMSSDTVVVSVDGDPSLWVQLLGVGTPETADARKDRWLIGLPDPRWLDRWLPAGTPVWMERRGKTATGRPLVLLYRMDGLCWNAFLVQTGGAYATEQLKFPEFSKLSSYEATAREKGLGLWRGYAAAKAEQAAVAPAPVVAARPKRTPAARPAVASAGGEKTPPKVVSATPRRRRPRYASQAEARAQVDAMMWGMMAPYLAGPRRAPSYGGVGMGGFGGFGMGGGIGVNPNQHYVRPHMRGGQWIGGHMQTNPNGTVRDNLSYPGNR